MYYEQPGNLIHIILNCERDPFSLQCVRCREGDGGVSEVGRNRRPSRGWDGTKRVQGFLLVTSKR